MGLDRVYEEVLRRQDLTRLDWDHLGLLLKVEMLYWLRDEEPQVRHILTGNAASNAHMVRVNEALGPGRDPPAVLATAAVGAGRTPGP